MDNRAYTKEEVRQKLVIYFIKLAEYWKNERISPGQDRFLGLVHSILATFDGAAIDLPAFDIIPAPHPDDKKYHMKNGENWYERKVINDDASLHDLLNEVQRNMEKDNNYYKN